MRERGPRGVGLVDSGAPAIAHAVRGLGTVRRLVLTHFHDDHTGGAAEVGAWPDAPVVRGEVPQPPPNFSGPEKELHAQVAAGLTAASARWLAGLADVDGAVDTVCFGHDMPVVGGAGERLRVLP